MEENKKIYTSEDIQAERKNLFDMELTKKQQEFNNAMNVPIPELPKFSDTLDKPIGDMEELISRTLAERKYEIQEFQNNNNNNNVNTKFLNGQETSIKSEKSGYIKPSIKSQINDNNSNFETNKIRYIKIGDELNETTILSNNIIDLSKTKNVSWGKNNEYPSNIENNIQNENNNIFKKLKSISPDMEIEKMKIQIKSLENKIDDLTQKIQNVFIDSNK